MGFSLERGSLFQNAIINGNFEINQRVTAATAHLAYGPDRWKLYKDFSSCELAQVSDSDTYGTYCGRLKFTTNGGSATTNIIIQSIEGKNSIPFRGKTVTLSMLLKRNSTAASGVFTFGFATGTGEDEFPVSTGAQSDIRQVINCSSLSTSSYTKVTATATLRSTISAIEIVIGWQNAFGAVPPDGSEIYIKQVQLNEGSIALPFQPRHYEEELALCQRYYMRWSPGNTYNYFPGYCVGTNSTSYAQFQHPVPMRIAPTAIEQDGTASHYSMYFANIYTVCTGVPTFSSATTHFTIVIFTATSGHTSGQAGALTNVSGYIGISAEI